MSVFNIRRSSTRQTGQVDIFEKLHSFATNNSYNRDNLKKLIDYINIVTRAFDPGKNYFTTQQQHGLKITQDGVLKALLNIGMMDANSNDAQIILDICTHKNPRFDRMASYTQTATNFLARIGFQGTLGGLDTSALSALDAALTANCNVPAGYARIALDCNGADLRGANLRDADLRGAKLSKEQVIAILDTAKYLGYRAPLAGVDFRGG